jgi:hypothetical protein
VETAPAGFAGICFAGTAAGFGAIDDAGLIACAGLTGDAARFARVAGAVFFFSGAAEFFRAEDFFGADFLCGATFRTEPFAFFFVFAAGAAAARFGFAR